MQPSMDLKNDATIYRECRRKCIFTCSLQLQLQANKSHSSPLTSHADVNFDIPSGKIRGLIKTVSQVEFISYFFVSTNRVQRIIPYLYLAGSEKNIILYLLRFFACI